MTVLLTGAAGFLGQRIAASLLAAGVTDLRLHVRSQPPAGLLDALRASYPQARIEAYAANLLDRSAMAGLVADIDCIIHAAAGMRGSAADMFANTVVGTRNVLDAASAAGVRRIVLISSLSVYRTAALSRHAVLDEQVPREDVGINRGIYAYAKTRQEQLFDAHAAEHGYEAIVLRPGVIYGPGGTVFSSRVGIVVGGIMFRMGAGALLPLTYVDNCADAVAQAAMHAQPGQLLNLIDDDLPSCRQWLRGYRKAVRRIPTLIVPYPAFLAGAWWLQRYHRKSKGQLPALLTPYIVRSMYRPLRYDNSALKSIGWRQRVPTAQALATTFASWRDQP